MWQSIQAFHQHPQWGLHVRSLTEESSDLLAGNSLAACISSLDLIRVSGADAETFLQGQTTCDFREVRQGQIRLGAHCNVKGRVQASFYALPQGEDFLLLLPKGQGEPTRAALAKYAMFSKATLSLDTSLWPLALLGPDARRWAARIGGADLEARQGRDWGNRACGLPGSANVFGTGTGRSGQRCVAAAPRRWSHSGR
ncbi:MAG: hypothetical protein R3F38_13675 [Gammaproteobacteria bacterium]